MSAPTVPPSACHCPLCAQAPSARLLELSFAQRGGLPDDIALLFCAACNFAYTSPREPAGYQAYYASTVNDQLGVQQLAPAEIRRYQAQAAVLAPLLARPAPLKVLDIGCGQAGLLRTLRQQQPQHHYHGSDPNVAAAYRDADGITYSHAWETLSERYDLVILSHTLEHILDFASLAPVARLLAPGGALYIELPDAGRYADCVRREYRYYLDRLHVNHFTPEALAKLIDSWGLVASAMGQLDFSYKDGQPYPAHYMVARPPGPAPHLAPRSAPLDQDLGRYLRGEALRASAWRQALAPDEGIVVYGFGDNFFRSCGAHGPLAGQPILAVCDRRWQELAQGPYGGRFNFIAVEDAVQRYRAQPFVVTLSWAADTVTTMLLASGAQRVLTL